MPAGANIGILPKIESADSVGHLSDILDAADGAMVARGDLGAELPVQEVSPLSSHLWSLFSVSPFLYAPVLLAPCFLSPSSGFLFRSFLVVFAPFCFSSCGSALGIGLHPRRCRGSPNSCSIHKSGPYICRYRTGRVALYKAAGNVASQ